MEYKPYKSNGKNNWLGSMCGVLKDGFISIATNEENTFLGIEDGSGMIFNFYIT